MPSAKSKKQKPHKERLSNSTFNQPVPQDLSSPLALSSFSPDGTSFAFLSLAIDKHRLRVYDTLSGQSRAEYVVDLGRVTSLAWTRLDLSGGPSVPSDDETNRPKKKRKKRQSLRADSENDALTSIEVVVLGLSDGSLSLFSPSHGKVLRTLSHPTSNTSILSVVVNQTVNLGTYIWTSGADGAIRVWNATKNSMVGSLKVDNRIPYSSIAFRPVGLDEEDGELNLLVANHTIQLLSMETSLIHLENQKTEALATFTGHASPVIQLHWDVSQQPAVRFVSMAQADRFMYIWQLPNPEDTNPTEGKIVASITLDSDARTFSLCDFTGASKQHILTLSTSGKISVFPIPTELSSSTNSRKSQKFPTLLPCSTISITPKKHSSNFQVVDVAFTSKEGQIRIAKIVGGVRPFFAVVVCKFYFVTHVESQFRFRIT
jgi:U3 small nucleolar RNA-associated protein 5